MAQTENSKMDGDFLEAAASSGEATLDFWWLFLAVVTHLLSLLFRHVSEV